MPRTQIKFVLKAEAPVAILRSRASSQFVKTLDYLPGSTVRGAFAEIFINKCGTDDPDFQRIFVDEKIGFGDFLPSNAPDFPLLLPLSAVACKRYGLTHTESLHDRLLAELPINKTAAPLKKCPQCNEPLDRLAGEYLSGTTSRQKVDFGKQLRMHVGIARSTGSAMSGMLFSYEMLTEKGVSSASSKSPELFFVGALAANSDDSTEVFAALQKVVPDREHLAVGKGRTRGLGELSIVSREELKELEEDCFEKRWQRFHAAVHDPEHCFFTITLNSHLALKDQRGRPVLGNLNATHLGLDALIPQEHSKPFVAFIATTIVAGWNAAQGLPKPDTHAISRGSVLVFRAPSNVASKLAPLLKKLEDEGLGERRAEGFGKVTVCDPFHLNF